ncbi:hypothetical protein SA8601_0032 [Staphylococcus aureus subsp. aureus SA8601]|nr:hypothetical protein [Staphylococcus aureus subsp. aureus SA8601]
MNQNFYFHLKFGDRSVRAFYNYNQLWIAPSKTGFELP